MRGAKLFWHNGLAAVAAAFLLSMFLFSGNVFASTYSASITTSGSVSVDVSASGKGASVSSDNLVIDSSCPLGYTVSIGGPTDSTLYKNGDSSNTASTTRINASAGTKQNPVSILGNNVDTWGYSIGTYSGNTHTPATINSDFIGLTSSTVELTNKNSASANVGDSVPVYYGVSTDFNMEIGSYTMAESSQGAGDNVITYYLTTSLNCTSYFVSFNPTSIFEGNTISGTGTMANQRISEGVPTSLSNNTFTAPSGYYFAGWNTSQDGSGTSYTDGEQVTDLIAAGQTITLYAQWTNCPPNKICYDKNDNGDYYHPAVGTMGQQSVTSSDTSVTLLASNYSRAFHGFAGWKTNPGQNGTNYGPQETITFTAGQYSTAGLKLYANWITSAGSLQSWDGCSSMSIGDVTALTDERDNNAYAVARLADGNCWMIENLRLESTNSDNSSGALAQGYGSSSTYGNFSGLASVESDNFSNSTTANSLYYSGTQSGTASINIGTTDYPGFRMPRYNNINTSVRATSPTNNDASLYSYGNYYTWHAAIADLTYNNTNNDSVTGTSLCPAGWHLPTGGQAYASGDTSGVNVTGDTSSYREYYNLGYSIMDSNLTAYESNAYNGNSYYGTNTINANGDTANNAFRKFPNNFLFSGRFNTSSVYDRGNGGFYWTSTAYNYWGSYLLYMSSSNIYPGTNRYNKHNGRSIRCMIQPIYNITYNGNGADSSTRMTIKNSNLIKGQSTKLHPSNFKRAGYGFAGWSTTQINPDASDAATQIANAKIFGPQETITLSQNEIALADNSGNITLYAVWVKTSGNLQSWTGCRNMTLGSVIALNDTRDNQVYTVARLADGNCWMTENLRLNDSISLNTTNTNNPLNSNGTATILNDTGSTTDHLSATSSTWCATNSDDCISKSMLNTSSTASTVANMTSDNQNVYSYGNYYNWYSATGARGDYSTNTDNTSVEGSICPIGWSLPIGGNKTNEAVDDYWKLIVTKLNGGVNPANYSSETMPYYTGAGEADLVDQKVRAYPNNIIQAGYISSSSFSNRGSSGQYWAGTARNARYSYGLYISSTNVRPGTYNGSKYVGRPVRCINYPTYNIVYNGNNADSGTTMSIKNTGIKEGGTTRLHPSNFKRAGYGFAGWSTTQINPDASDAATQIANAKIFGPQENMTLTQDEIGLSNSNGNITLYAVWVKSAGNIQQWSGCSSLASGGITALKDTRDNQVYAVAKLADGKCWMIENLRLDNTSTLTTTNSNNPVNSSGTATIVNDDGNTTNHLSATSSSWCTTSDSACLDKSLLNTSNTASSVATMTSDNQNVYSYGNYYNWYSATGARGKYSNSTNNSNMGGSICPRGWRLPYGGNKSNEANNDFWNLIVNYLHSGVKPLNYSSSTTPYYTNSASDTDEAARASQLVRKFPNNFVFAGNFSGSTYNSRGTFATYHTATSNSNANSYSFSSNNSSLHYPGTQASEKYRGRSIRCLTSGS